MSTPYRLIVEHRDGQIRMIVEDDGTGFPDYTAALERGFGLIGMRERVEIHGGTFTVESSVGSGTTVYVEVPIPKPDGGERLSVLVQSRNDGWKDLEYSVVSANGSAAGSACVSGNSGATRVRASGSCFNSA